MRRNIFTTVLLLFILLHTNAQERKKVAVVLSGGGAKGMAHISALKIIEEAGIPIDFIVGTSMGGLVGGLYAVGYTPYQIDSLARVQEWRHLLSDNVEESELTFSARQRRNQYLITVPFNAKDRRINTAGLIEGKNIEKTFLHLLSSYTDSISFDSLPVSFACVATDLLHGREYVFRQGRLYTALRATMSFPAAFTPVELDTMLLVDGGVLNNYPVDVARQMGADYVIGVDVQDNRRTREDLAMLPNLIMQLVEIAGVEKYKQNIADTDIYIRVPVEGYNVASFSAVAIDSLMLRGEFAARQKWSCLQALRDSLGLTDTPLPSRRAYRHVMRHMSDSITKSRTTPDPLDTSSVSIGLRFDSEELAMILLDANYQLPMKHPSTISSTLRLGQQIRGRLGYNYNIPFFGTLNVSYQLGYHNNTIYEQGNRAYNITYLHHTGGVSMSSSWRTMHAVIGAQYEYYYINDLLARNNYQIEDKVKSEDYFSYYAGLQYDDFNKRNYPTKGRRWSVKGALYTDDLVRFNNDIPILAVQAAWKRAICLVGDKALVLLPFVHGRMLLSKNRPYSLYNYVGGQLAGRYMLQQLPFMGINYIEVAAQHMGIGGLKLRGSIGQKSYLTLTTNYGILIGDKASESNRFAVEHLFGTGLTYGYDTPLGPIEATLSHSTRTRKLTFYINLGFPF